MPAFLQSFIEAEQERSRRIEQLRKEIREFAKEEAGSSITEQILLFLADEMVEHLSEIDYELRMKFELYITPLIKRNYIYRYTGTFDRIRQAYIRERMKTPAGQRECEWKYKNEILFVPYHSDPVIVKSVETVRCRSNMVWNFKAAASEKLKRQIFTVLEYILENYEISRLRENIKVANLQMESAYLNDNLFKKLSDKESPYWKYFDCKGDIQLGWWYHQAIYPMVYYHRQRHQLQFRVL